MNNSNEYPKIAVASLISSGGIEDYQALKAIGVESAIIPLNLSMQNDWPTAVVHTDSARIVGLQTHACVLTDLKNPVLDAKSFFENYLKLDYAKPSTKILIQCQPASSVKDPNKALAELLGYIRCFAQPENIDLGLDNIEDSPFDIEEILKRINLTIFNPGKLNAGVDGAGTWIYTTDFNGSYQQIGYDYYGFYTNSQGYQLTLDGEYVAQPGDTWVTIATRHGLWLPELLKLNDADYDDLVVPGQHIKLQ